MSSPGRKLISLKQLSFIGALATIGALMFVTTMLKNGAAPEVQFNTLKGERINTSDLRGKVVLVNFWATDCEVCVREMPKLVETYRKFEPRGFETIAVAMRYDPPNFVVNYAEKNALPFKVALDVSGELAQRFGNVSLTPTTFIIARDGRIVKRFLGEPDFEALHVLLEKELKAG
ncbi:MAG: TlpA disulfide reductase family protein [Betaproteobacteria bacterium]